MSIFFTSSPLNTSHARLLSIVIKSSHPNYFISLSLFTSTIYSVSSTLSTVSTSIYHPIWFFVFITHQPTSSTPPAVPHTAGKSSSIFI